MDLDVGGVEVMIDDRDGVARFYDINALSNFVAKPLDVLGWDPHDRLVDYLARPDRGGARMRFGYWMPGVRRLAAQRARRGHGGELGLYQAARAGVRAMGL